MGAPLNIITGRTGSGRSRMLMDKLRELTSTESDARLIFIVPEQFTFETERALATELSAGLLNISVMSFTSLAKKVLRKTGDRRVFLSEQGRRMAIRRALLDAQAKQELRYFGRSASHTGFSGECDKLFIMLKRAGITSDMLKSAVESLADDETLKNKLSDISLIYERIQSALEGYIDGEDAFKVLSERLAQTEYASAHIFIDGFDLISARLYDVLGALMDYSLSLTVALRLDTDENCRDSEVFFAERKLLSKLTKLSFEHDSTVSFINLTGESKKYRNAALAHLEREAFAYPYSVYSGKDDASAAITITAAHDAIAEVEIMAEDIAELIRGGKRYRDIAIIAANMDAYINIVSRALSARELPFFTDAKHRLSSYSAPRLIIDALYSCARGFSTDSIVNLMKTGLAGITREETEKLENYALKRGIRSLMLEIKSDDEAELLESARLKLMEPLLRLREKISSGKTVKNKVEAIYEYTVELAVRDKLVARANELKEEGRLELMEEISQLYEMTMELFSQLHAIMGDEELSNLRFAQMVEEGFDAYEVGVIPTGADQVLFGSIGRTKAKDVDIVFILGASEGSFPTSVGDDTVINDAEVGRLISCGLEGWQSATELNAKELSDAYGAATKPRERLYLSYSSGSEESAPCELYLRLKEIFSLTERNDITFRPAQTKETGFLQLTRALRAYLDTGIADGANGSAPAQDDISALYGYFSASDEYAQRFALIGDALHTKSSPAPLPQALVSKLYRGNNGLSCSATQLESYNSCPFKHFARYALRAQPRKEYKEKRADEGIFVHEAMQRFSDRLIELGEQVKTLKEKDCSDILDLLLPDLILTHNDGILNESARMRAAQRRLVKLIKTAAYIVVRQLQAGEFSITSNETKFGRGGIYPAIELELSGDRRLNISGVIDRLDEARGNDGKCVRVVDYKTGSTFFDYTELYHGIKIQLPIYLAAALSANEAAKAAGMYYLPIKQPSIDFNGDTAAFERNLYKHFKLNGLTLSEASITILSGEGKLLTDTVTVSKNYLVTQDELAFAQERALTKAKEAAEGALSGCVDVSPYKIGKYTVCGYCDYKNLCRFDESLQDCTYRRLDKLGHDDFFASASEKEGADNGMD